ncbi:HypC/HybG/HupF family hydrogenase formation chaperone [Patescibacteria group bacterium]
MCVGIPGKVIKIKDQQAQVKQGDHVHWWDLGLIKAKVQVGDWLLAYQNTATDMIASDQAREILSLIGHKWVN